jgi:hypothetical protein
MKVQILSSSTGVNFKYNSGKIISSYQVIDNNIIIIHLTVRGPPIYNEHHSEINSYLNFNKIIKNKFFIK